MPGEFTLANISYQDLSLTLMRFFSCCLFMYHWHWSSVIESERGKLKLFIFSFLIRLNIYDSSEFLQIVLDRKAPKKINPHISTYLGTHVIYIVDAHAAWHDLLLLVSLWNLGNFAVSAEDLERTFGCDVVVPGAQNATRVFEVSIALTSIFVCDCYWTKVLYKCVWQLQKFF